MNEKKALFCVAGTFSVSHVLAIEIIEGYSLVQQLMVDREIITQRAQSATERNQ